MKNDGWIPVSERFSSNPSWINKNRLQVIVCVLVLVGLGSTIWFPNYSIREEDQIEAARLITAWLVEGKGLPGFGEVYPDAKWMPRQKRFFVICDCLPKNMVISPDPRVEIITKGEYEEVFKKYNYMNTDYLRIEAKSGTSSTELMVTNSFGWLGGHGYRFVISRKLWGLRFTGKLLWVS